MARAKQSVHRQTQLQNALVAGVHWGQALLHETGKAKGDPALFGRGALTLDQVKGLAQLFEKLVTTNPETIVGWTKNKIASEDAGKLVSRLNEHPAPADVRLPVNALTLELVERTGGRDIVCRPVANLLQLNLQEDKDGTLLQDLFRVYIALGLKVNFSQLGLPVSDADLVALAKVLAAKCAKGPYVNDEAYYRLSLTRIEMWGVKNTGQCDRFVLAKKLLQDPEIKKLLPALKALPPKRAAFVGYSMMMSLHWATYGSWNDVASEVMRLANPKFDYAGFQYGGIRATRALKELLPKALEYKPTETFLLMALSDPGDDAAFETIIRELQKTGSEVYVLDDNRPWIDVPFPNIKKEIALRREIAKKTGARLLEFYEIGKRQPAYEKWECLDKVHMTTEGHLFYAKELLKLWAAGK